MFKEFKEEFLKRVSEINYEKKETGSLSELIFSSSQNSFLIKIGKSLEDCFNKYSESRSERNLKPYIKEHILQYFGKQRDLDILFEINGKIYYFEVKSNLNLDTEKSKATADKVIEIGEFLRVHFPEKEVIYGVLSGRYGRRSEINHPIKGILKDIKLFGYKDFFEIFDLTVNTDEWEDMFKEAGKYYKPY